MKDSHPFYTCEFCGCNTNAHLRRCCDKGYRMDVKKCKKAETKRKLAEPSKPTLETVTVMVKETLEKYVDSSLLRDRMNGASETPSVSFEIANDGSTTRIRMMARHGPFGQSVHRTEFKYYSLTYIEQKAVTNQLFNTLTWEGSPYYWNGVGFSKRMIVAG